MERRKKQKEEERRRKEKRKEEMEGKRGRMGRREGREEVIG